MALHNRCVYSSDDDTIGEIASLVEEADIPVDIPSPRLSPQPVVQRGHRGHLGAGIRRLLLLYCGQVVAVWLTVTSLLGASFLVRALLDASLRLWVSNTYY